MIITVPPKTLTADQKGKLTKKGYVVIETDEPEKVKVIMPEQPIQSNDLLMAALKALTMANEVNSKNFVNELYKRLKEAEIPTTNDTNK